MSDEKQIPPRADARYRVHRSVKCYVAELQCGEKWCTWYFDDYIERVVYLFPGDVEKVVYKNKYYELKGPDEMRGIIDHHLADKGAVVLAGKTLDTYRDENSYEAFSFIDITTPETSESYQTLRPVWLNSDEYKNS